MSAGSRISPLAGADTWRLEDEAEREEVARPEEVTANVSGDQRVRLFSTAITAL